MQCPSCHAAIPDVSKFCLACGAAQMARCPSCGHTTVAGGKFCVDCGTKFPESYGEMVSEALVSIPGPARSRPTASAERRQLTVMYCDLVGSTALSTRLDPEDMRAVIRAYHRCCASIIVQAGGFVAQYMGDG